VRHGLKPHVQQPRQQRELLHDADEENFTLPSTGDSDDADDESKVNESNDDQSDNGALEESDVVFPTMQIPDSRTIRSGKHCIYIIINESSHILFHSA
jgi:hypothetical protein